MKKIAILTSGGDAPGMNACIRAVVRSGVANGYEVVGIIGGYQGLIDENYIKLGLRDVGNIIQTGGTILKTSRCAEFMTDKGFKRAVDNYKKAKFEAIIVIGGNGSLAGATDLYKAGVNVIGIPGTIDNDLGYTDFTLGFDTAVNTVTNLLNNVRDTSSAHDRVCVVEVMGRKCGDIALYAGISAGAEIVLIPEVKTPMEEVYKKLINSAKTGKKSSIVVVAEGVGNAGDVSKLINENTKLESKAVVIGHLQRGGSPSMADRVFASRLGVVAVEAIQNGEMNIAIGTLKNKIIKMDIEKAIKTKNVFDEFDYRINSIISI